VLCLELGDEVAVAVDAGDGAVEPLGEFVGAVAGPQRRRVRCGMVGGGAGAERAGVPPPWAAGGGL
jgi:hypothetical protein